MQEIQLKISLKEINRIAIWRILVHYKHRIKEILIKLIKNRLSHIEMIKHQIQIALKNNKVYK